MSIIFMKTKPITPCDNVDLEEHFQVFKSLFALQNPEPMNVLQEKFYWERMETAVAVKTAYKCGDSFIYLTTQPPDGFCIIACNFVESGLDDAYLIASTILTHYVLTYRPIGEYFGNMLPFLNIISIRKWRLHKTDVIKVIKDDYFEALLDYYDV